MFACLFLPCSLSSLSFMTAPFSHPNSPERETGVEREDCWGGRRVGKAGDKGGGWWGGLLWRRTRGIENGRWYELGETEEAYSSGITQEWENGWEGGKKEEESKRRERNGVYEGGKLRVKKENNSVRFKLDRIIFTQGVVLALFWLWGCQCRQRPQGGAVTEGALTRNLLSPAHQAVSHSRGQAVFSLIYRMQANPTQTFRSRNKNRWR